MSEHDEKSEERIEDLDVPEAESEDVKGGLLPARGIDQKWQKFQKVQLGSKHNPGVERFGDGSV